MPAFAVILNEENPEVSQRIEREYPEHYRITDTVFLLQSRKIADAVAVSVGIKGENRVEDARGVVFKLNSSYAGYSARTLWDWLQQVEEER